MCDIIEIILNELLNYDATPIEVNTDDYVYPDGLIISFPKSSLYPIWFMIIDTQNKIQNWLSQPNHYKLPSNVNLEHVEKIILSIFHNIYSNSNANANSNEKINILAMYYNKCKLIDIEIHYNCKIVDMIVYIEDNFKVEPLVYPNLELVNKDSYAILFPL